MNGNQNGITSSANLNELLEQIENEFESLEHFLE